ncbi:MAG TPA: 5'-nucleotidase C-terminal domain-containing protein [Lacunisphaera sp.]|nr:5'-nucleotidase C-terminal domain-containing protein [Lacunisphaera sp.]
MKISAGLFFLAAAMAGAAPPQPEALFLVVADQHSAYERTAQVVATVDRLKAEHPGLPLAVLIDGDTLEQGNALARRSGGAIDFAMLAALARRAPTVLNLGNHEAEFFDLAETVKRAQAAGVAVVSDIADRATGRPFAPASTTLHLGRVAAVVAGLATDNRGTYRAAIRDSLAIPEPVAWARRNLPALLAGGAVPIVLSHAGLAADRAILPDLPDGTLFAGAHDHLRFVQPFGRTLYFHSGSWNQYLSLAWLDRDAAGTWRWTVEQVPVEATAPGDPELARLIAATREQYGEAADRAVIGHSSAARSTEEAGRFVAAAVRRATGADAAFIGNTTLGGGLPAGDVTRETFDACVRFDGDIFVARMDGARLLEALAAANQGPDTPFGARRGGFLFADGPARIDPARQYRVATHDWIVRGARAYFGDPAIAWQEQPGLRLKAIAAAALAGGGD